MRILFLTYSVVGQSNYLRAESLALALAGEGHHVTLFGAPRVSGRDAHTEEQRIRQGVVRRKILGSRAPMRVRNSGLSPLEVLRRRAAVLEENFDLVHGFGHRPTVSCVGPLTARRLGVPYVADWCDLFGNGGIAAERATLPRVTLGLYDRWLEPRVYRRADAVSVISRALESRARRLNPSLPVTRVPPGGLPAPSAGSAVAVRQRLDIPAEAPLVVHVSQNHQDLELLRETIIHIGELQADARFLLVGPEFPILERAGSPGLAERIHLTGAVPHREIAPILAAADVALLPYPPSVKNECRFPCSFPEYAASGLPIVTQPTGDLGHLVREHGGALLVPAAGVEMARAADRILSDADLAAELSGQARRLAGEELSWSVGACRLLELYRRVTAERITSPVLATT